MRVRILRSIVSNDWAYQVGQVADLDDATALAWCRGEDPIAERAEAVETATVGPPEMAVRRTRRRA